MKIVKKNLWLLLAMICCISATSCSDEPTELINGVYSNPDNTFITSSYQIFEFWGVSHDKNVFNQKIEGQNVSLKLDSNNSQNMIELSFSPNLAQGNGMAPSIIGFDKEVNVNLPYEISDNKLTFNGEIETDYLKCYVKGTLQKENHKNKWTDSKNKLTIDISQQSLNNTFEWDTPRILLTGLSKLNSSTDISTFDYKAPGGFICYLNDVNSPEINALGLSIPEFFNLLFNIPFLSNTNFGAPFNSAFDTQYDLPVNGLFTRNAFKFLNTGDLVSGSNYYFATDYSKPSFDVFGEGIKPYLLPSSIRYIPISESDCRIFILPDYISRPITLDKSQNNYYPNGGDNVNWSVKFLKKPGYQQLCATILSNLESELANGLNLHKQRIETIVDYNVVYNFLLDSSVSKKILSALITLYADNENQERLIDNIIRFYPEYSREDLSRAINALPMLIQNSHDISFGLQLTKPSNPYGA